MPGASSSSLSSLLASLRPTCLVVLLTALGSVALAQDLEIVVTPEEPVDFQRIDLEVVGQLDDVASSRNGGVVVDGLTIELRLETTFDVAGTAPPVLLRENFIVEPLGVGGWYRIDVIGVDQATGDERLLATEQQLVTHRVGVEIERWFSDDLRSERIRMILSGIMNYCVSPDSEPVINDGHILVEMSLVCGILPSPGAPYAFDYSFDDLEPGEWVVEIVDSQDGRLLGFEGFDVLEGPPGVLHDRFYVSAAWRDFDGQANDATAAALDLGDGVLLWFFDPSNPEMLVKVLDGCAVNGHYWVLTSASTNVEYVVTVSDFEDDNLVWRRTNALGERSPAFVDIEAFDCSTGTDGGE